MKSLVPWICFFAASASYQAFAENDFSAYRLGNYDKAMEPLMSKSGKDAVADYYLGRMYLYGYGQLKNNDLAMRYFMKSAEKGYLPAVQIMAKYALMHDKNPEQATRWFKQAASSGDVDAQLFMAASYLYGIGVKKNVDTASHYFIDAAKNGSAIAQYALADGFLSSRNAGNNKLGLIWLNKAANNGNPKAQTKLGALYVAGKLVPKDVAKGKELLNKAIAQDYIPAILQLGDIALVDNEPAKALEWYNKAANQQNSDAYLRLAHAYLQSKSSIYDPKSGFLWTLKAAQNGSIDGKKELANLYAKGIGVEADQNLAQEWLAQANQDEKKMQQLPAAIAQAALWLTNDKTNKLEDTNYQMKGIFSAWQNEMALKNNIYNEAPRLELVTRHDIFKPQFELTQPNEVPITYYYDVLMNKKEDVPENQWMYPSYALNPQVVSLEHVNSAVVAKANLPAPYMDADYMPDDTPNGDLMDIWMHGWQAQVNFMSMFSQMYSRAILGDAQAQFEIGQLFQYGIGVAQNDEAATVFYQNAAEQLHLGAEYNLGLMYLKHAKDKNDYQTALNWLTDAAFKGNSRAQYVLARLLSNGKAGPDGTQYITVNKEQALSMLYLSAANHYGPAEYELAEHLAREDNSNLSLEVRKHKIAVVRQLYEGAAKRGVAQALIPLAFYNAMDSDKQRQAQAFIVADAQANAGDEKAALLLGLLYDRGIGVAADPAQAMFWYGKAGANPASQFILGTYYTEGKGVPADKEEGLAQLQQAANAEFSYADFNLAVLEHNEHQDFLPNLMKAYSLGNSHAGIVLADYYLAQHDDPEKMKQAQQIYTGLAEKGDQYAQLKLAYMLDKGMGGPVDPTAAQRWYTASADQGDALSQYLLGQFYQQGVLGEPDYNLAKQWYEKAASQSSKALVALGYLYETVDDNYAGALKNYEKASQMGDKYGDYNLALMYEYGKGTPTNFAKAKTLFTEAANQGVSAAMNQLASMSFYGLGQARNEQEAYSWYKKAADLGNSEALYALGLLSESGVATKLDYPNAIKYYQAAADKGNDRAMLALARMYQYGLGINKDIQAAHSLYEKLADKQNAYAQYQLGTYYLENSAPDKARKLLQQASDNGNFQARQVLQKLNAQSQGRVSFVEPIIVNHDVSSVNDQTADMLYLDALNEWNRGDELSSRMLLHRLVKQYPNFALGKRAYETMDVRTIK